ncbi:branched-chain amino acid ABC transporter permease [Thermogladius sp. 4427co]|uniref:branched-chain amino acid ABC transporter permease n=1 Tax=Thermogladius sp. 4427co TaxID=3450718 RepID=UPI003F7A54EF
MIAIIGRDTILALLIFEAVLILLAFVVSSNNYYMLLMDQVLLFAGFVGAWNIIGGLTGQLDLAASAYIAIGGITTSALWIKLGVPPVVGVFAGGLASALLAVAIGIPTFRFGVREVWYALLTASLVVILNNIFRYSIGPWDFYLPSKWGWVYLRPRSYFELFFIIDIALLIVVVANLLVVNSKLGYYLKSIREDELVSESIGIDTRLYKLLALSIYSFITGVLGYLQVVIYSSFSYRLFDSSLAISIAIMGIIGGLGSIGGSIASAMVFRTLGEYLRSYLGGVFPGLDLLLYGLALIVFGITWPDGLAGMYRGLRRWFKK